MNTPLEDVITQPEDVIIPVEDVIPPEVNVKVFNVQSQRTAMDEITLKWDAPVVGSPEANGNSWEKLSFLLQVRNSSYVFIDVMETEETELILSDLPLGLNATYRITCKLDGELADAWVYTYEKTLPQGFLTELGTLDTDPLVQARYMTFSPDGATLFLVGFNDIFVFNIGIDGQPSFSQHISSTDEYKINRVNNLFCSPDSDFVYVPFQTVGNFPGGIHLFKRNQNGDLVFQESFLHNILNDYPLGSALDGVITPDGRYLYFTNGASYDSQNPDASNFLLFSRNLDTGVISFVKSFDPSGDGINGLMPYQDLVIAPESNLLFICGGRGFAEFSFNELSGDLTLESSHQMWGGRYSYLLNPRRMSVSPNGNYLYLRANNIMDQGGIPPFSAFYRNLQGEIQVHSSGYSTSSKMGEDYYNGFAISPDGKNIYQVVNTDNIRYGETGGFPGNYTGSADDVVGSQVAVSPDGNKVYVWGSDKIIYYNRTSK
ncbi:MAG: hypothetical protein OCD02_13255 [Spirochaetaceae bacterium]